MEQPEIVELGGAQQGIPKLVPLTDEQIASIVEAWHEIRLVDVYAKVAGRGDNVSIEIVDTSIDQELIGFLAGVASRHELRMMAVAPERVGGALMVLFPNREIAPSEGLRAGMVSEDGTLPGAPAEPDESDAPYRVTAFGDSVMLEVISDDEHIVTLTVAGPSQQAAAREVLESSAERIIARLTAGDKADDVFPEEQRIASGVWARITGADSPTGEVPA